MGNSLTNIGTYIGILLLAGLFLYGLSKVSSELITHEEAELNNESLEYAGTLIGINVSDYEADRQELEESVTGNISGGNIQDQSIEFLYGRSKTDPLVNVAKQVYTLPSTILIKLLKFKETPWTWVLDTFVWGLNIFIVIAGIYFARGIIEKR